MFTTCLDNSRVVFIDFITRYGIDALNHTLLFLSRQNYKACLLQTNIYTNNIHYIVIKRIHIFVLCILFNYDKLGEKLNYVLK